MSRPTTNASSTVYVGNVDERVSERVLYDILIEAGRVVELYIPRDKDTDKPKGFAFAQYESDEIADYAVNLFSGLVSLYNRTLKFAMSGQDKPAQNGATPASDGSSRPRHPPVSLNDMEFSHDSMRLHPAYRVPAYPSDNSPANHTNGYGSQFNYDDGRRVFGAHYDTTSNSRSRHYDNSPSHLSY